MIVFGVNPVCEALKSQSAVIARVYLLHNSKGSRLQPIIRLSRDRGLPLQYVSRQVLDRTAGTARHQGVAAEMAALPYAEAESLASSGCDLLVLADGVEDPQNLGSLIRTAECAGAGGLVLPARHSCGLTPAVVKASAGACFHLPVARVSNVASFLRTVKEQGFWVVGLDMQGEMEAASLDVHSRLLVAVGGEDRGLRRLTRENCDYLVSLPLRGKVSSLNLSVAAGVLLYQIVIGRRQPPGE